MKIMLFFLHLELPIEEKNKIQLYASKKSKQKITE